MHNSGRRAPCRFLVAGAIASLAAPGCSSSSGSQTTTCGSPPTVTQKSSYRVGFSQVGIEGANPWRIAETGSMKSEAAKRGATLIYEDANGDIATQLMQMSML